MSLESEESAREIDSAQRVGKARNAEHQSAPIELRIEKQNRKKRKRKTKSECVPRSTLARPTY